MVKVIDVYFNFSTTKKVDSQTGDTYFHILDWYKSNLYNHNTLLNWG